MGTLGFVFDIISDDKDESTQHCIVFFAYPKIQACIVAGFVEFPKLEEYPCFYLYHNEMLLKPFLQLEKETTMYTKISLSQKTMFCARDLTFWFNATKYKRIRELLTLDKNENIEKEFFMRTFALAEELRLFS
ncbi:hypothetical protein H6501_03205 [Candidatus Woesearchaeota archaeon]|nr:hypothetical protein [Nanoarchaeota archaeon]MCB9370578.1 hypothetical protein [Candidatus Woesearchaeota archaeon]USN43660.1 MAG: hypothetical protein H6500_04690 [Candidatus Woesearchaeota archaeon]